MTGMFLPLGALWPLRINVVFEKWVPDQEQGSHFFKWGSDELGFYFSSINEKHANYVIKITASICINHRKDSSQCYSVSKADAMSTTPQRGVPLFLLLC
jgi:hypothetical protein